MSAISPRSAWVMLLALVSGFALSQAFRTVAGLLSVPLQQEFMLSGRALGIVFGSFHFAFAGMQILMGIGVDVYGIRRTILLAFPLAVAGSLVSALAVNAAMLLAGQVLIGIGCSPAFLVCMVFIARHFPQERFSAMSGVALGLGGLGLLYTGTPLAWMVQAWGWRGGYFSLVFLSLLAWLLIFLLVAEPDSGRRTEGGQAVPRPSLKDALRGYGELLKMPQTAGIFALAFVVYASFITLRGLWLGPLFAERFSQSLVFTGHVALALSIISMLSPSLFGRLDPGSGRRAFWMAVMPWALALCFIALAFSGSLFQSVSLAMLVAVLMGSQVWHYANVRSTYPSHMTGRGLALFNMSMFFGVAFMQFLTGQVAALPALGRHDAFTSVFCAIAAMLALGTTVFSLLPKTAKRLPPAEPGNGP